MNTELVGLLGPHLGIGLAALAALSVALTSLGIRIGTDNGDPTEALTVVLACNVLLLVPIALVFTPVGATLTLGSAISFAAAGITGTLLGRVCYFTSITRIGSSRTEPIKATQPLHATVIAMMVFGERVTTPHFLGIVLVVVGVGVVSWEAARGSSVEVDSIRALLPGFAAALFFGLEPILAKLGMTTSGTLLLGLALRIVVAAVAFVAYLRFRDSVPTLGQLRESSLRWYVAAGLSNTLFLLSYYSALQLTPVSVVVPIIQTSPLVVIVLSLLFLPARLERVTWQLGSAATIVVAGAMMVTLFS